MSGKQGSPDKRCPAKQTSDKGESSTPTQQSPQKQCKPKRRRRNRVSSSSSDGIVHEARRDLRHMERLLLHSGKLHVFRAYFDDPDLHFYTRPEGRQRHPAGARNRRPPDENRAIAVLGMQQELAEDVDNNPLQAAQVEDEGPPSVVSSRGVSSVSSFTNFPPSPPPQCHADFEMVPFEGLPPFREESASARPRSKPVSAACSSSSADHDDYMASGSASESDESARRNMAAAAAAVQVADRFTRMVVSGNNNNPAPLPDPEPMSLSSDPPTPRESD